MRALRHRSRVAVQRGLVAEDGFERLGIHRRDRRRVERRRPAAPSASAARRTPTPSSPAGRAASRAAPRAAPPRAGGWPPASGVKYSASGARRVATASHRTLSGAGRIGHSRVATKLLYPRNPFGPRPPSKGLCRLPDRTHRPRARRRAGLRRLRAYARLEAMRAAAERVRAAYSDVRGGRHPPGPARARHRLGRHPAPPRRPRHRRRAADLRAPRHGGLGPAGTSAASRSRTRSTPRSSSTGGRPSPSPSTGRPRSRRWASCAAATSSPARAARSSASTTRCSTRSAVESRGLQVAGEGALLAALERNRTGRMGDIVATIQAEQDEAIRADIAGAARRRGRTGHRQDRGRAAPRRVPPLHAPPPARGAGRAARRAEPGVPALHRARAAVARRAGRAALDDRGLEAALAHPRAPTEPDGRGAEGRRAHGAGHRARGRPIANGRSRTTSRSSSTACGSALSRERHRAHRSKARSAGRGPHNEQRPYVARRVIDLLVARYKTAAVRVVPANGATNAPARQRHEPVRPRRHARRRRSPARSRAARRRPKAGSRSCASRLRARPEVKEALERMWPVLSGAELSTTCSGSARSCARPPTAS